MITYNSYKFPNVGNDANNIWWAIIMVFAFFILGLLIGDAAIGLIIAPVPLYILEMIHIINFGFGTIIGIHAALLVIYVFVKVGR
jgi:hypothetical protein